jgi:uncharacterized membrane protein
MATEGPLRVLVATFSDVTGATRALATLAPTVGEGVDKAAVALTDDNGKVRFAETHDRTTGQGALQGAGIGAMAGLVGLLFGPVGLLGMPIGAAVGGLVGKLRDTGYDDDELRELGADLSPGTSALVATIREDAIEKARRLLSEVDVRRVIVREVDADLATALDADIPPGVAIEPQPLD